MGAKVKAHGKPKVAVSYYELHGVLGADWQIEATDYNPDVSSAIPHLTGVYLKGRAVNLIQITRHDFLSLVCDRFSLQYRYPTGEEAHKAWQRLVGKVMSSN